MSLGRLGGSGVMSLIVAFVCIAAILMARDWPFEAALFPVGIGLAVLILDLAALILILTGKGKKSGIQVASDFSLTTDENGEAKTTRRTLVAFAWIVGFFLIILLFGFKLAPLIFVFFYSKFQGREKWGISIALACVSWVFFWGLFIWLLDTSMEEGLIFRALHAIGIG